MLERNIYCTHIRFSQYSDLCIPFYLWKRAQMEVLRILTPTEKLPQPQQLQAQNPKLFPGLYRVCAQQTSLSCIPSASLSPLLVAWGWVVSCLRAGWEWKGAWPGRAAIPPVTEENFRPAANFARSQTSLHQLPNRNQEVTSSLVPLQDKDESTSQSSFRKKPRSQSLIVPLIFFTQKNWKKSD